MKKKAIVFGGSGFVGSHVADALTETGYEVTIFDIASSPYINENQKFIQGSILDAFAVKTAIEGHNYVYHLAGQADIEIGFQKPRETLEINIMGTTNILEGCRQQEIERFVFASSIYVYSDAGGFYKVSKQACELIIEEYQKNFGINYTILRYGSLYGRRADERNLIYRILKQALLTKCIKIGLSQEDKRDYIHVKDAARNSVEILSEQFRNSHVMLTGHQQVTRAELIRMICEMLGGDIKVEEIKPEIDRLHGHYQITPYVFKPTISKKLVSHQYLEFGQGILDCMDEIYQSHINDEI